MTMSKRFSSENTKSLTAKQSKEDKKKAELSLRAQEEEDKLWEDPDKQLIKKQQRKANLEEKKIKTLTRKQENKALLQTEEEKLGLVTTIPKVTRAEIESKLNKKDKPSDLFKPLVPNTNRQAFEGEEARNVKEAIRILNKKFAVDRYPEKRVKAAYSTYESRRMIELRIEFPNLKFSQLKQIIMGEWQKSDENPMNQK